MKGPDDNSSKRPSVTVIRLENFVPVKARDIIFSKHTAKARLVYKLLEEKYGKPFVDEYKARGIAAMFEDEEGEVDIPDEVNRENLKKLEALAKPQAPLLPAIDGLIDRMMQKKKISDILDFAMRELGLNAQQTENAASETLRSLEKEFVEDVE